jgi:hypothetical protein
MCFPWPAAPTHGEFEAELLGGVLHPLLFAERSATPHSHANRFQFRFRLHLVD